MELSGGGGWFWELSSAFNSSPAPATYTQHEPAVLPSNRFVVGDVSRARHSNYNRNSNHVFGTGEGRDGIPGFSVVDQHLTCLKLGKRHYLEDVNERRLPPPPMAIWLGEKKRKGFVGGGGGGSSSQLAISVARCQVEGCNLPLVDAKEYHRKHKVCEMHSKAPKVVVLGLEQRFCQQCSRFHVVSEFDYSKRSCRRRLAGHNERRRKSSNEASVKNPSQGDTYQFIASSPKGSALSLLSSKTNPTTSCWDSSDLSLLSSVALRELIAENRVAALSRQLASVDRSWASHISDHAASSRPFVSQLNSQHAQHHLRPEYSHDIGRLHFHQPAHVNVTLDLMQAPSSSYQPRRRKNNARDQQSCGIWKSLEGTHIV